MRKTIPGQYATLLFFLIEHFLFYAIFRFIIKNYCDSNKVLYDNQSGFSKINFSEYMIWYVYQWCKAMDKSEVIWDCKQMFETTNKQLLFQK